MKKEYDLKKMKRVYRAPLDPKTTKIAMSLRIDADVFLWLGKEAHRTGIPYQTLLNSKLREAMTQPSLEDLVEKKVEEVLARKRAS
jgi:uncharacterized protein (DUF4415 family)